VLVRIDAGAGLVDVADLDRLTDLEVSAVERLEAHDRLEQRGLADAVRADDSDDAVRRQTEAQSVDERTVAEPLLEILRLDHDASESGARGDLNLFEVELPGALGLGSHLFVSGQTRLGLGLTSLGAGAHPLEFVL